MKRAGTALILSLFLMPFGSGGGTAVRAIGGGALGLAAGTAVAMGVVVARARFENVYIESMRDVISWQGAPIPLGALAGGAAGVAGGAVLAGATGGMLLGGGAGALVGAAAGAALSSDPQDRWVGGVMGGALGVLLGFIAGWLVARRRNARRSRRRTGPAVAALLPVLLLAGCAGEEPLEPVETPDAPDDAAAVEDVVVLVGDPGKARYRHYPIIPRVAAEVERWATTIGRDSAVTVLVLGDIIYPDGMHDPGTPGFTVDSARVSEQVDMVRAPGAMRHAARMYFVAGNHDWGVAEDQEGARRLRNLGAFLDRVRERGANVDLAPVAGSGVPDIVDIGDRLRLILLDTAWWIFDAEPNGKEAFIRGVADAMAGAGDRRVVLAAHHPFESAGPHGGLIPIWRTLGIRYLLYKSGALLQDLSSRPYQQMKAALGDVFLEHGRPLAFAGGHEHSLQVIAHDTATAPHYSIVSGSASKLTGVRPVQGTLFQRSAPGYVQLLIRENGAVDVEVIAAPERFLACPEDETAEQPWEECMAEGQEAFSTVYAARLVDPDGTALERARSERGGP